MPSQLGGALLTPMVLRALDDRQYHQPPFEHHDGVGVPQVRAPLELTEKVPSAACGFPATGVAVIVYEAPAATPESVYLPSADKPVVLPSPPAAAPVYAVVMLPL